MSIVKIKDICLCTGLVKDNNENRSAYDYLTSSNIDFKHLAYWDPAQHQGVWDSLQTWIHDKQINTFPIVHYHQVDDQYNTTGVVLVGLSEIMNSDIVNLSKL